MLAIVSFTICVDCGDNPNAFLVRSYQGTRRCLDYTPEAVGSPIFINDCAQAHPIVVHELRDGKHTVVLLAGTKVIMARISGGLTHVTLRSPTSSAASTTAEYPLTLQNPPTAIPLATSIGQQILANQHFALDGDSIILSASMPEPPTSSPVLVAKVKNARGAIGTPVVLGARDLADNEFWDFLPTNKIDHDPTSGFKRVSSAGDLYNALTSPNTGWGTVIKLDGFYDMSAFPAPFSVPAGVAIRGNRRGTHTAPVISGGSCTASCTGSFQNWSSQTNPADHLFDVEGDYVRFTGLYLQGPSRLRADTDQTKDPHQPPVYGIFFHSQNDGPSNRVFAATVDHNELSDWPEGALIFDPGDLSYFPFVCDQNGQNCAYPNLSESQSVAQCNQYDSLNLPGVGTAAPWNGHVARNFVHHNEGNSGGYGVSVGGRVRIAGNTYLMNRHPITSDAHFRNSYTAKFNLVLSNVPGYGTFGGEHEQDFDMHGSYKDGDGRWLGGIAGNELDIGWNTFFGNNRKNFWLRGVPCATDYFHDNVSEESELIYSYYTDLVRIFNASFPATFPAPYQPQPTQLWVFGNKSSIPDPTARLGVGDFDGDCYDDLFLATGASWYYSPGGKTEWRFLSAKTDTIDQLLFGDFDGDGRTDVVAIHNGQFVVSWGGISDWEVLNPNPFGGIYFLPSAVSAMAVGDFDGDGISDIFYADGQRWWVSYGGNTPFVEVQTSGFRVQDLRFGDFNADGTTDVFSVGSENWQVSYSPKGVQGLFGGWQPLRSKLTDTVQNLVVADFNGKGFADVATSECKSFHCSWLISYSGTTDWNTYSEPVPLSAAAGIGHFLGDTGADVLLWNGGYGFPLFVSNVCDSNAASDVLCILSGPGGTPQRQSGQEMR